MATLRVLMRWLAPLSLAAWGNGSMAAPPHLELEITLDPQTRAFHAKGELAPAAASAQLSLNPAFKVSRVSDTAQRLSVEYSGTLPPLPESNGRDSRAPAGLYASPEGTFLAAGAGWYPDPGVAFTYRLKLSLPAGQKGLAPGRQVRASESGSRFTAEYEFAQPAEGIWLMAGPFEVAQQKLLLDNGTPVTVRTWFHPELASLSGGYLQDSLRYLQRYSRLIGDYPFGDFSIVSSPLPHGLGMPSLTYLGRDVLRLPFIRATSLGHEVLHNWWGNGVYPEWSGGNWSEGLTTFMADYAYREDQSAAAAREMRLNWLRDLAAIAAADETALADFKSRHHGISSVIGYSKSAMLFFMLRDEIGAAAFERGLQLLWQGHRFRTAGWPDLEAAFSRAAGRDLSTFFAQWVRRPVSARLLLAPRRDADPPRSFRIVQQGAAFDLLVPLRFQLPSGAQRDLAVRVRERETVVDPAAALAADATQVELDPDWRLWRRLDSRAVPPIFREVFISPRTQLVVAGEAPTWRAPAAALAARLLDAPPREAAAAELLASPEVPALIIGDRDGIVRLLASLGIGEVPAVLLQPANAPDPPAERPLKGSARAWTARASSGKTFAVVLADSPQALLALQRAMPHYGRQSWLVFQDGRVAEQGSWPVPPQRLALPAAGR